MSRFKRFVPILLVLLAVGTAIAEVVYEANKPLTTAAAVVLSSPASSADSTTIGTTPVRPKSTHNCPRVIIAPTLSLNTATCCLAVVCYQKTGSTYTGEVVAAIQTFTGTTALTMDSGRFITTDGYMAAPTLGCQIYDVRILAISAGNVTWRSWPLGADTTPSTTASE